MVNINDFKDADKIPDDITKAIFEHQMTLAKKYVEIENMGTLLEGDRSLNIQTKEGQLWIKEFAWRVTEELCESIEPVIENTDTLTEEHEKHYKEELADALHFFVEMCIIAGVEANELVKIEGIPMEADIALDDIGLMELQARHFDVVYYLGLMCNTLKNKRWKQSQIMTDIPKFKKYLILAWVSLITCFKEAQMTDADIYNFYHKKNEVNQFRQRSKY